MNDKELLTLAAKAAGIDIIGYSPHSPVKHSMAYLTTKGSWNPLTDDGDALRLAVKLRIDLCFSRGAVEAVWINEEISETHSLEVPCDEEFEGWDAKHAATRRAIVRAAAEIGKSL